MSRPASQRPQASPLPQVVADGRLVEALALTQELGDVFAGVLQQVVLYEELDPLENTAKTLMTLTPETPRKEDEGHGRQVWGLWAQRC